MIRPHLAGYGVVVGATLKHPPVLDQLAGPVLLPGVGAHGATAQDVKALTIAAPEGSPRLAR